jgi:hypothetical protein
VDWLDKAAENAKREQESMKKREEQLQKMKAAFPDYCMRLWIEFDKVFKKIEEKFGKDLTSIKAQGNHLVIKIADVTLEATAEQQELMGGYFGSVDVDYQVANASGGPELPYNTILLTKDGRWVYRDKTSLGLVDKNFGEEQIMEIFKTALWKYNK